MDPKELRLGTSTVGHLLFTRTTSDPKYIKDAKFNNLESISLGTITLSSQNVLVFGDIILNSYSTLKQLTFEINLKSILRLHDKECQHQIIRLLTEVIPCCVNLQYLKAQFQGINEGLYLQHKVFIHRLFNHWLDLHQIQNLSNVKGLTLKLSYHFTRFLVHNPKKTKQLLHFLSNHPSLDSIHLILSDFNRTDSPIASFIASAPSLSPSAISVKSKIDSILQQIFESLKHRKCPLRSFRCNTFSLDASSRNNIDRIIQHHPNLTRFDVRSPDTVPSVNLQPFKTLVSHFIRFNKGHLVHFRCSGEQIVCDEEVLDLLSKFIGLQTEIETLDVSNICFTSTPNQVRDTVTCGRLTLTLFCQMILKKFLVSDNVFIVTCHRHLHMLHAALWKCLLFSKTTLFFNHSRILKCSVFVHDSPIQIESKSKELESVRNDSNDLRHSLETNKGICSALECLLESMMKSCPELRVLQLPRCDVLNLELYLDICYRAVIESNHVWQHQQSKLMIPICVDQEWILNVCSDFSESNIDTFFHPIYRFVEKIVVFQRDIYPLRLHEQEQCCHQVLKRQHSVDADVMGLISSFGIRQCRLQIQFVMNIPLLGTNYMRRVSHFYNDLVRELNSDLHFIQIVDHCFESVSMESNVIFS